MNKGWDENRVLTCDQVSWMLDVFDRYLPKDDHVRVSQQREMMMYGMLYEIMDVANLHLEDEKAVFNATPNSVRGYTPGEEW